MATDVFGLPSTSVGKKFDAKNSASPGNVGSLASKIIADRGGSAYLDRRLSDKKTKSIPRRGAKTAAEGFIPNFAAGWSKMLKHSFPTGMKKRSIPGRPDSFIQYSGRDIDFIKSQQKGDGYKIFNSFLQTKGRAFTDSLVQNR